jgi:DNA repair protein RadC
MMGDHDQLIASALAALDSKMSRDGLPRYHDPLMAVVHAALRLSDQFCESLLAYWLDRDQRLLGTEEICRGSRDTASFSRDYLARRALASGADSCVLIHNHPSGEPGASEQDIAAADRVDLQPSAIGVLVTGHYVVSGSGFSDIRTGSVTLFKDLIKPEGEAKPAGPVCPHCNGPLEVSA